MSSGGRYLGLRDLTGTSGPGRMGAMKDIHVPQRAQGPLGLGPCPAGQLGEEGCEPGIQLWHRLGPQIANG